MLKEGEYTSSYLEIARLRSLRRASAIRLCKIIIKLACTSHFSVNESFHERHKRLPSVENVQKNRNDDVNLGRRTSLTNGKRNGDLKFFVGKRDTQTR